MTKENKQDNKYLMEHVLPRLYNIRLGIMMYPKIIDGKIIYSECVNYIVSHIHFEDALICNNFIKMMPTGACLNGRLIYERDITLNLKRVAATRESKNWRPNPTVCFSKKKNITVFGHQILSINYFKDTYYKFDYKYLGNSIENPELLEDK